jgi:hypothetical protein
MSNPLAVRLIVFALILGGAYAGWKLRKLLPTQHLTEETKNLASVSTAIVATLSALVLWASHFQRKLIVYPTGRRSHGAVGTNSPIG